MIELKPPTTIIEIKVIDSHSVKCSTLMKLMIGAYSTPPSAANAALTAKASTFSRATLIPMQLAASWLSRIATSMRPGREFTTLDRNSTLSTTMTSTR